MAKKTYIVVKRGILDKRHIFKINNAIWLFLYMLDIVGWEEGIIHEWKDKDAAEELGFNISTIRNQRRLLESQNYISCEQHLRCLKIKIKNWTNPREYSGKVYNNKNYGVNKLPPLDVHGDNHGDSHGDSGLTPFIFLKEQISNVNEDPLLRELEKKWGRVKAQLCSGLSPTNQFKKRIEGGVVRGVEDGKLNIVISDNSDFMNERVAQYSEEIMEAIFKDGTKLNFICIDESSQATQ